VHRDVIHTERASSGFLERYYDGGTDLREIANREALETRQIERLARAFSIVVGTASIPRRIGSDATSEELAIDKRRARRFAHALRAAISGWVKRMPEIPNNDEIRRASAQMNWAAFLDDHVTTIQTELRYCATWAIKHDDQRWGRSAVVRLENELNWVTYALRD
jgi:hypothetical protein